jgi:hypothetical protein
VSEVDGRRSEMAEEAGSLSFGVEEELLLVDPGTGRTAAVADEVVRYAEALDHPHPTPP